MTTIKETPNWAAWKMTEVTLFKSTQTRLSEFTRWKCVFVAACKRSSGKVVMFGYDVTCCLSHVLFRGMMSLPVLSHVLSGGMVPRHGRFGVWSQGSLGYGQRRGGMVPEGVWYTLPPPVLTSSGSHQSRQYASSWNSFLLPSTTK